MTLCMLCGAEFESTAGSIHYCPNFPPSRTWQASNAIRLLGKEKILQQAWISSDGQVTWRNVETVTE